VREHTSLENFVPNRLAGIPFPKRKGIISRFRQDGFLPQCLTSNRRRKLPTNERVPKDDEVCYSLSRIILTFVLKNDCFGIPSLHLQHLPV